MQFGLTFDDVCLVPQYNNVPSRTEPDTSTWLTKNIEIGMPLIPANMDTVISPSLAEIILRRGGMPIFHRFASVEKQVEWIKQFQGNILVSCGIKEGPDLFRILEEKPKGVCIDVAHGHSEKMHNIISTIKKQFPHIEIVAGNVCTPMAYQDLVNAGADAVKVGVGPGAACTTRIVTGFGVPQFTAVYECAQIARKLRVPIIADGGIRNSRDVVLALAAGASTVMIGKLFALTEESAAEKKLNVEDGYFCDVGRGTPVCKYRGQASEDFQNEFYGGLKEKTVAEGTDFWAPVSGSANDLIDEILGGLRSGLTYGGARSIKELQRKAEFMQVSNNYGAESNPRRKE
ncbi:MAG: guanosine monophosphate reductase [Candidatus Altiarchaeales archaeon]|nr:guanosine monophosphate reductase [Candidatus Altiarchaeales archaeon]